MTLRLRRHHFLTLLVGSALLAREPLAQRIAHNDPARYFSAPHPHGGAGDLRLAILFEASAFQTNLLFLHRGVIPPKSGIGHHVHGQMEEMFVILDNEAEFTVDGRTTKLTGPAGAPCRMGRSHGIYNPTDRPTEWLNVAVSTVKGKYDAFDLGDDRVGAPLDAKPAFISYHLNRSLLRPVEGMEGGKGKALYRRVLPSEIFSTNWAYVDHLVIPPGSSLGRHRHAGVEELFYVLKGEASLRVNDETAVVRKGDAIPILLNDAHSFETAGGTELEALIIGVAREKGKLDVENAP